LQKFDPKNADKRRLRDGWLSFLQNPCFMDASFLKIKEINDAMETLKYISADPETRAIADLRQKTINDRNSEMTVAVEEAEARGKAEGKAEEKRETARKMLKKGVDLENISGFTGLSVSEIKKLKNAGN
jgi:predicted transposase/invertase (TIGR01784 family)